MKCKPKKGVDILKLLYNSSSPPIPFRQAVEHTMEDLI